MSKLTWEKEDDIWIAPDGKVVAYERYISEALNEDGFSCYYIVLHKFSKNTYVYLQELYGADEQSAGEKLIKIGKAENSDRKRLQSLIDLAKEKSQGITFLDELPEWYDLTMSDIC